MNIQWYPGHMHKASKEMKAMLPSVDLIIEVLDARIPFSSENPMLASIRGDKPCIKILNKHDLADPNVTQQWQAFFDQSQQVKALPLSVNQAEKTKPILALAQQLLPNKAASGELIQTLIMGIPNVGKSTLINSLAGRTIAKTGNEPAITKGQQRIALDNGIVLHDTPGVLWPNLENRNTGFRLAATGAIKDTALDHDPIAYFVADYLLKNYPEALMARFQLASLPGSEQAFLESLGKARGCLMAGGKINIDKVAKILLTELRSGSIGRISLETPLMMQTELVELAAIREQKAAKKEARKLKFKAGQ